MNNVTDSKYKFYYINYPFGIATDLCIKEARLRTERKLEQVLEFQKVFCDMKNYGIVPTLGNVIHAYDIVEMQIENLLKEEYEKINNTESVINRLL